MKTTTLLSLSALLTLATSCGHETAVSYTMATVTRQDVSTSVTATGAIEPVTKVEVGTQVSGIIDKIYVDFNSQVRKGQVIAELDKTNLLSEHTSAQSNLANAQSELDYQKANFDRYAKLFEKGLVSVDDYETARLAFEKARQNIVVQQQNVTKAQTNVGYATITSPIDGVVLSREVEEGQTVASAMTTPTLFYIAQDLTDMRVIADVDEADIGGVKEGQRVSFTVDAFPDDTFAGTVTQVRLEATTESNVVTYEVVIAAPNKDLKLLPGLTANVTIYTAERNNVLTLPSKTLRFTPNQALLKPEQRVEDVMSPKKVWTFDGTTFRAKAVETGLNGGINIEIISGLTEGEKVIESFEIGKSTEEVADNETSNSNPFMPGPPGQKKNKK
ncbi:MAG: efflux RND transporter periplasmic adaptor subunit [Bacteroidales bacterium]|nr:efflux RND transporter periplasmic adaptor subunit [Bacteroidales bacterium]MDY4175450.1 efflux RND transporter periplasmic adaptor subunit [Bacteroidales bacterium]